MQMETTEESSAPGYYWFWLLDITFSVIYLFEKLYSPLPVKDSLYPLPPLNSHIGRSLSNLLNAERFVRTKNFGKLLVKSILVPHGLGNLIHSQCGFSHKQKHTHAAFWESLSNYRGHRKKTMEMESLTLYSWWDFSAEPQSVSRLPGVILPSKGHFPLTIHHAPADSANLPGFASQHKMSTWTSTTCWTRQTRHIYCHFWTENIFFYLFFPDVLTRLSEF